MSMRGKHEDIDTVVRCLVRQRWDWTGVKTRRMANRILKITAWRKDQMIVDVA